MCGHWCILSKQVAHKSWSVLFRYLRLNIYMSVLWYWKLRGIQHNYKSEHSIYLNRDDCVRHHKNCTCFMCCCSCCCYLVAFDFNILYHIDRSQYNHYVKNRQHLFTSHDQFPAFVSFIVLADCLSTTQHVCIWWLFHMYVGCLQICNELIYRQQARSYLLQFWNSKDR